MFDRFQGVKDIATGEGTHVLVPWLQKAILYDVRIKPRNISTTTGSKDLQMVSLTLRVLSRPDIQHLPKIYQSLGIDYDERVLPSIGNEVLKATVAQFDAAELITQREVVSARIREDLLKRAKEFNIVLEDVSITHMTFGQDFTRRSSRSRSHSRMPSVPSSSSRRPSRNVRLPSFAQRVKPRRRRPSRGRSRRPVTVCSPSGGSRRPRTLLRRSAAPRTSPIFHTARACCSTCRPSGLGPFAFSHHVVLLFRASSSFHVVHQSTPHLTSLLLIGLDCSNGMDDCLDSERSRHQC